MSQYETINYSVLNAVANIRLNRPKAMNAMSQQMRQELKQAIGAAQNSSEVRVVVISAEGKGFSAGTDLTEGLAGFETIDDQIQQEYKPLFMAIANSSKPYIASINGPCAGIGAAFAMACDLAIMAEDSFLYLAFSGLSLVPDGGMSHHLVNAMGYKKAYQLYLEAGRLTARDCEGYGLINKVVAAEALATQTQAWAESLAKGAPLSQKFGKQIMRQVSTSSFEETFDKESELQVACSTSKDAQSAVAAFFKKEKPVFVGE